MQAYRNVESFINNVRDKVKPNIKKLLDDLSSGLNKQPLFDISSADLNLQFVKKYGSELDVKTDGYQLFDQMPYEKFSLVYANDVFCVERMDDSIATAYFSVQKKMLMVQLTPLKASALEKGIVYYRKSECFGIDKSGKFYTDPDIETSKRLFKTCVSDLLVFLYLLNREKTYFVVEKSSVQKTPKNFKKKAVLPEKYRTRYLFLPRTVLYSKCGLGVNPEDKNENDCKRKIGVSYLRRGHRRYFRDASRWSKEKLNTWTWIKPIWVGKKENQDSNYKYKVILDFGKENEK